VIKYLRYFFFQGIFGKLIGNIIYAWSVHLKGAVYVTSFMPFQIVISVALGVIFLGDTLHIGRYG
jgi:drug/metabolite transporter (DMT)-like permease